jgi:hypothetical protein
MGAGVLSCVVDHILQEFNTVSDQIKNLLNCYTTPNKNTKRHFGIWRLYSSFVHGYRTEMARKQETMTTLVIIMD